MNSSTRRNGIHTWVGVWVFVSLFTLAPADLAVRYTINTEDGCRPISPLIYGTNLDFIRAQNLTIRRLGGNRMTGYNWENNASNAGSDWNHVSDEYETTFIPVDQWDIPGKMITDFIDKNNALGMDSLITLQMAGYVAADKDDEVSEAETAPSPRWNRVIFKKESAFCCPPGNPDRTDGVVYIDELVNYLVSRYGTAAAGGPRFYGMDNEPALWPRTHPRLRTQPVTCQELVSQTKQLAAVVKDLDPHAQICGPVLYGFAAYHRLQGASDWDEVSRGRPYRWFIDYYLDQMRTSSEEQGRRLLDVLALHWYPEARDADGIRITDYRSTDTNVFSRMQAPRTLWDPDYVEKSWIGEGFGWALPLLPNLINSIEKWYPETKLGFTEYDYGGKDHVSGGIALADVLGIFGKYGVYLATYFEHECRQGEYSDAAFNLYRNYDGRCSVFGDISVEAMMSDKVNSSIYASVFPDDKGELHLIVLNKSLNEAILGSFTIAGSRMYTSGRVWAFDAESSSVTERKPIRIISQNAFDYRIPPLTACHFVLNSQQLAEN